MQKKNVYDSFFTEKLRFLKQSVGLSISKSRKPWKSDVYKNCTVGSGLVFDTRAFYEHPGTLRRRTAK